MCLETRSEAGERNLEKDKRPSYACILILHQKVDGKVGWTFFPNKGSKQHSGLWKLHVEDNVSAGRTLVPHKFEETKKSRPSHRKQDERVTIDYFTFCR